MSEKDYSRCDKAVDGPETQEDGKGIRKNRGERITATGRRRGELRGEGLAPNPSTNTVSNVQMGRSFN